MGNVSSADLTQLESIANQVSALQPTIEALGNGLSVAGTSNCRWGNNASTAYTGFDTAARAATKSLAGLLPEQAAVIHNYVREERAIQEKTQGNVKKVEGAIPTLPKVEPTKPSKPSGGPNPNGTWTI